MERPVSPIKIQNQPSFVSRLPRMPSLDARSRSSRTRIPFEKIPLAFNPLKFLAMSLIEKNQQRKELELQKNMNEFAE
jgi:hypothetical protein